MQKTLGFIKPIQMAQRRSAGNLPIQLGLIAETGEHFVPAEQRVCPKTARHGKSCKAHASLRSIVEVSGQEAKDVFSFVQPAQFHESGCTATQPGCRRPVVEMLEHNVPASKRFLPSPSLHGDLSDAYESLRFI